MTDQTAQVLASLAEGLDAEEQEAYENDESGDDDDDDSPLGWWVDFCDGLTDEEREAIELNIRPVQMMLTKVSTLLSSRVEIDLVSSCASLHTL